MPLDEVDLPPMSRGHESEDPGFWRLLAWPLLFSRRYSAMMRGLNLADGCALVDLDLRRSDHRRLAVRLWLMFAAVVLLALVLGEPPAAFVLDAWSYSLETTVAFAGAVAVAGSVPVASTTLAWWIVLAIVAALPPSDPFALLGHEPQMLFYAAAFLGTLSGIRYDRRVSVRRYVIGVTGAPLLLIAAWLPARLLAAALFAVSGGAMMAVVSIAASHSFSGIASTGASSVILGWQLATKYALVDVRSIVEDLRFTAPTMSLLAAVALARWLRRLQR
jgi:hypothetical protein